MEVDPEVYARMKVDFNKKMEEVIKLKHINNQIFTYVAYQSMIQKIEHAKSLKFGKTPTDYARLKKYDILEINGEKRLVVPFFCSTTGGGNTDSSSIRKFVYLEEVFDILHNSHLKNGHKRRTTMTQDLKEYKNLTREMINVYLSICEPCNEKNSAKFQEQELDSKTSCIDLIEMPEDQNGYNLILLHLDVKTQFVQLRPLKNAEDVTSPLLDIFSIFGSPDILQGDIDRDLGQKIVAICNWADFKITFMKSESKVKRLDEIHMKITELLNSWRESNSNLPWSEGLKFVQYMKNKEYNRKLGRSAGEAMFGNRFGRIVKSKRTSQVIDQTISGDENGSTEQSTSEINESQSVIAEDSAKRIKTEPSELSSPNVIIIQKVETFDEFNQ